MDRPDAPTVMGWSKLDFAELDYLDADALEPVVGRAIDYVAWVTGRPIDATMPAELVSLAQQAIQMRTEQLAMQSTGDYIETATDDEVQSFSAGSYSETRRDPSTGKVDKNGLPIVNSWPSLNEILWMLMTDEKADYWKALFGIIVPAFEVTEVDWSASDIPPEAWPLALGPYPGA